MLGSGGRIIARMQLTADQQQRLGALCRQYNVGRLRLFGSAATGDERPDSDVDLLVESLPGAAPSAFALVDLRDELSALFDRSLAHSSDMLVSCMSRARWSALCRCRTAWADAC
jgi:predicted nucleotidyltransferase